MGNGRKIYNSIRFDKDGNIVEEDSFFYRGPLALCEGEGGGEGDWKESFPEEVRELEIVRDSPDQETFYKRLQDQQTFQGQAIRIPSEEAGEDDWKAFNEKLTKKVPTLMQTPNYEDDEQVTTIFRSLGAPEKPEDYKAPELKTEEGQELNSGLIEKFTAIGAKYNLTQKQYEGILSDMHDDSIAQMTQSVQERTEDRNRLKAEWGSAFDEKVQTIGVLLNKTKAPAALIAALPNMPSETVKWLDGLVKAVGTKELDLAGNLNGGKPPIMTPNEATLKISEIRNNKEHPYNKPNDPGYKAAKAKMRELYVLADPDNATKPVEGARHSF